MNSARLRAPVHLITVLLVIAVLAGHASVRPFQRGQKTFSDSLTFAKREKAYRANNLGVALLEQYNAAEAAKAFSLALEIDPNLSIARINLSIALYYSSDANGALREAQKASAQNPKAPQPHYMLGLTARAQNRIDEAIAEFEKVLAIDGDDVGANVNLGQLYVQQKRQTEASAALLKALAVEPYNETALYNLGILLTRTGSKEQGQQFIQRFQQLRQSGAGRSLGTNYLEQGRYAEAIASTGAEPELVDRRTPDVRFVDASGSFLNLPVSERLTMPTSPSRSESARVNASKRAEAIVLFDYDGDGDLDIFETSFPQRLLRNDAGKFVDVTARSGLAITKSKFCFAAVAGDYDNDGKPDLFVVGAADNSPRLYHNDGNGYFSDKTNEAGMKVPSPKGAPYVSAAFVDVDHDGDLDIFIAGPANILFRNNGGGPFTDISQMAKVTGRDDLSAPRAIVPTDFDNRRDVDLFVLQASGPPALFRNMRDGTFLDVAKEAGLAGHGAFSSVAAGDINKDGFTDFFLGAERPGVFAISDGRNRFRIIPSPAETRMAQAAQFLDYDNDGLLDLVVVTIKGLRLWRNIGGDFVHVSTALASGFSNPELSSSHRGMSGSHTALASGDLDGDGDVDLILRGTTGELRVLRNDGGSRNRSIRVNLRGRVSNRSAVEAKVELRAGSLWQRWETYSASPAPAPADIIFGLGRRATPDAVRVLWPAGIVQAETDIVASAAARPGNSITLDITELDRKPSSCPYLYTWNGERFQFVTDFMGGSEMGHFEARGRYNVPDPDEYVRISDDQLKEKNGKFEIRVTNELEEALFVDRLQLLAIAHTSTSEIYPNEGMTDPPRPFKLFVTSRAKPPLTAFDDHGHDVLERVSELDRRYPDDFRLDRIRGYAEEHTLTMELPGGKSKVQSPKSKVHSTPSTRTLDVGHLTLDKSKTRSQERTLLLMTGWTDYSWSSDNVAATQAGKTVKLPSLQVKDESGRWRTVIENIGIPVGRPQTVTVDLTGKFLSRNREVRIVTNMRIYWDQILVDASGGDSTIQVTKLDPSFARLNWRGFSRETTPDGREPFGYDYERVSFTSPWKVMTGNYTREGDVRELLLNSDDMFVISRPGDEISISFDAIMLPPLPRGWKRTFLLYADGFSKEMDINSASPDHVSPLPFHGMSRYPYKWPERYPLTDERRKYIERYNTRVVTSPLSSIDTAIVQR